MSESDDVVSCAVCQDPIFETGTGLDGQPVHIGCYHKVMKRRKMQGTLVETPYFLRRPLEIPHKRLSPTAQSPTRSYEEAAGWDLYADKIEVTKWSPQQYCTVGGPREPKGDKYQICTGDMVKVKTGIAMAIPVGYAGFLWDRSGLGSKGIHRLAGVIDSDYRGEITVILSNVYDAPYEISIGDKCIQLVIQEIPKTEFIEVDELPPSERGTKGFGSSGK